MPNKFTNSYAENDSMKLSSAANIIKEILQRMSLMIIAEGERKIANEDHGAIKNDLDNVVLMAGEDNNHNDIRAKLNSSLKHNQPGNLKIGTDIKDLFKDCRQWWIKALITMRATSFNSCKEKESGNI